MRNITNFQARGLVSQTSKQVMNPYGTLFWFLGMSDPQEYCKEILRADSKICFVVVSHEGKIFY
jgi:hypothetical protein